MSFSVNFSTTSIPDPAFSWPAPARWFAVHTRSRFEQRIAGELFEKGVENYLPVHTSLHQWKDRRKAVALPLFPGYLFCRLGSDAASDRLQVLRTPGVVRILGFGGEITPVPDGQIDAIRRLLASDLPCFPHAYLRRGSAVRIKSGPLRGLEGILVQTKTRTRLVLSVELLCQSVAAEVDAQDVEALRFP